MRKTLKLKSIPEPQVWEVESHNIVRLDKSYEVVNLDELKELLQHIAHTYRSTPDKPPLGILSFRYELDDNDRPVVIHALFTNKHSVLQRFARLRRKS